jgi:hypothetical protein
MGGFDLERRGEQCINHMFRLYGNCINCTSNEGNKTCDNYSPINVSYLIDSEVLKPPRIKFYVEDLI